MSRLTSSALQSVLALGVRPVWAVEVWDAQGLVQRVESESAFQAMARFDATHEADVRLLHGVCRLRRKIAADGNAVVDS